MRAKCVGFAMSACVGFVLACHVEPGQAQPGPEDGGAVLRNPFDEPAPKSGSSVRSADSNSESSSVAFDQILAQVSVDPRYAINKDIQPTPDIGPWMVCIHSYVAKEAPEMARQMTYELRTTYRLPAYVFTYGLEERRKEFARVKDLLDRQREFLKDKNLELMYAPRGIDEKNLPAAQLSNDLPLTYVMGLLKVKHIQVQCAVLVGGYASEDVAKRALDAIRKLQQPDPNKVKLDIKFYGEDLDPKNPGKSKVKYGDAMYVNPFTKAFVCRNPSVKQDRGAEEQEAMDINVLRKLNGDESFSLLHCKKPITLAIKQFQTFTTIQSREESASIMKTLGFKTREGEGIDQAAHDAHNLAELLRKNKLDAYVLHTKYASIVTVGGYDSPEDPNLRAMHSTLENRLRSPEWARLMFFPRPMPMKVPR